MTSIQSILIWTGGYFDEPLPLEDLLNAESNKGKQKQIKLAYLTGTSLHVNVPSFSYSLFLVLLIVVRTLNEALREYKGERCGQEATGSSILRGDLVNAGNECEDEVV